MIPASHQFRIHKFGQAAPWVDSRQQRDVGRLRPPHDFLENPQWISDFLEFWEFRVPLPGPAVLRDLRKLRTLLRHVAEENFARCSNPATRPGSIELMVEGTRLSPPGGEPQNGLALTMSPYNLAGPLRWPALPILLPRPWPYNSTSVEDLCECRLLLGVRGPDKGRVKRWCSDATCGNRDRVRRSRAAQKG